MNIVVCVFLQEECLRNQDIIVCSKHFQENPFDNFATFI